MDSSALRTTSELVQGMLIRGKYEVLNKIGAGGMATVYRARHVAFNEIRAIKVVRGWMADDDTFVRRLRTEAVITRRLQHPNAVRVDDIDDLEDGRPFIVMEFVEGQDLRRVIKQTGPMTSRRALQIASQVASALSAAHALGITHRDIKPDNILLPKLEDGTETVKVLDFGIAKVRNAAADGSTSTKTGLVLCTPEYASPEQARGGQSHTVDHRSDLYSLGVVLYEMLTGDLPFHSDTPLGMLLAHINMRPRPPAEARPGLTISKPISDLLMKSLEKDPDRRFQSAQEMLDAMSQIDADATEQALAPFTRPRTHTRGSVIEMPSRSMSGPATAPRRETEPDPVASDSVDLFAELDEPRRRWPWAVAALLVLIIAAAFVYAVYLRPSTPSDADTENNVRQQLASGAGTGTLAVSVSGHVAYLSGDVPNQAAFNEAVLIATQVPGVQRVETSKVRDISAPSRPPEPPAPPTPTQPADSSNSNPPPKPTTPASTTPASTTPASTKPTQPPAHPVSADGEIQNSVKTALASLGHADNIRAKVSKGVVTLTGSTDSQETLAQAISIIDGLPGVVSVDTGNVHVLDAEKEQKIQDLFRVAQRARDDADYDHAIAVYSQILQIDPGNKDAEKGKRDTAWAKLHDPQVQSTNDPQ